MIYDAISFVTERPFRAETSEHEFDTDAYCLDLDGAITLHLKSGYINNLLGNTHPKQRQIRKWHFYTTHLNCLYLLLDSFILQELKLGYFEIEEINIKNADVVSKNGVAISSRSYRQRSSSWPEPLKIPSNILRLVNDTFLALTSDFERVYVLSELAKSLAAYKSADLTTSFVLAWFLIERFIEVTWARFIETENRQLEGGQARINTDRRKALNDTRSYTAAVKLQMLELASQISFEQFSELDELRWMRNEVVHPKKTGSGNLTMQGDPKACALAFKLLQQFIERDFGLRLVLNTSYSHTLMFDRQ